MRPRRASYISPASWWIVRCSRLCLHFGVRLKGEYVNPLRYLGGVKWSVLMPRRWPDGWATRTAPRR